MRIGLHDEGLVLLTPEIPGEPSESVRQERGGNGLKRIRGFAHSGDSFRRSRFRRASGGPIFSVLPEKMGEKRGAGVRFGACCGCGSGKHLFYSRYEHTDSPYGRYGTRRLLWYTDFSSSCDSISAVKSLAFEAYRVVRIRRSSFWCRTGAGAPLASHGGSWLRSEAEQTDEGLCSCICKPRHKFMLLHCMHPPTGF